MAIIFFKKKNTARYFLFLSLFLVLVFVLVWLLGIAKKHLPSPAIKPQEIKIDFSQLKNPKLKELMPFSQIPTSQEPIGKNNPFSPFATSVPSR
jgi:hypothetical protein